MFCLFIVIIIILLRARCIIQNMCVRCVFSICFVTMSGIMFWDVNLESHFEQRQIIFEVSLGRGLSICVSYLLSGVRILSMFCRHMFGEKYF